MTDKTVNTSKDDDTQTQETTPIQCLIRRKGGTRVPFGHNTATQKVYHFKPIDDSENAPHVCNVDNEEHADTLLAIREAYRLYRGGAGAVAAIPVAKPLDEANDPYKNRYDDILSIDFDLADNEVVAGWAKEVLDLTTAKSAKIREKAKSLDVTISSGDNMMQVLRNIGKAMQEEERQASIQAENDK